MQDNIWLVCFDHPYDLAMHFCRAQEYYESNNPKFKGNKEFDMLEYMEWYAKDRDGSFTYPIDWRGFNIPGQSIDELYDQAFVIKDPNKYDKKMRTIVQFIKELIGKTTKYYLIGTKYEVELETLKHEVAHGLYHIRDDYHQEQTINLEQLDTTASKIMREFILNQGYSEEVVPDETHAFMISEPTNEMLDQFKTNNLSISTTRDPFIRTFNKYYKGPKQ